MSTAQAVSAVTAAIRSLLDLGTRDHPAGTVVTTRPPDKARNAITTNQLNVFLYQTTVNAAWRNEDMPSRVRPGETSPPPLPLTLHYLLTAYGNDDDDMQGHHVLGQAMSVLHDHPILSHAELRAALGPTIKPFPPVIDQSEHVRITFQPMSLDELSKLWMTLQTQYRISATYQVSVVLIDSLGGVRTPLPVLRQGDDDRGPTTTPDLTPPFPALTEVLAPDPGVSVELGDTLVLRGHHLDGDTVEVRFRHSDPDLVNVLEPVGQTTAREITVQIPDNAAATTDWPAGVYTVSVAVVDTGLVPAVERVTSELPLALAPRILTISPNRVDRDADGKIAVTLTFVPELRAFQRVALLIGDREVSPESPTDPTVPLGPTGTLDFIADGIALGDHFARLRVAGVDSILVDRTAVPLQFDDSQRITVQ
jgi:hypothetical protein